MPGLTMGAGLVPPLQLNLGSSATSGARGGSTSGSGMGALNEGDWITQTTGQGDNTAVPGPKPPATAALAASGNPLVLILLAGGALWMLKHK